ncbi:hypothetical protein [Buttiauxella sp.]|uniref:hypothetical protein n=1 Tax=Buttiauxella sp. TaxID=1972222 RepID=UPI003C75DC1C
MNKYYQPDIKPMNKVIIKAAQGLVVGIALLCGTAHASIDDCNLAISQMQIDYGKLNKASQSFQTTSQGDMTVLDKRTLSVMVSCNRPESIKLQFSGIKTSGQQFAFGQDGGVKITLRNATMDSKSAQLRNITPGATDVSLQNSQVIKPDTIISPDVNSSDTGVSFAAMIDVEPVVKDSAFNMQDAQQLVTQMEISLVE